MTTGPTKQLLLVVLASLAYAAEAGTTTTTTTSSLSQAAFVPFIDGGKDMPKMYDAYFNEQIAKQACTAVKKAVSSGKKNIEVNFPPVPNLEEVRFGTPLNQKFGTSVISRDLSVKGGYKPGSNVSRQLVSFSNVYWAKKIAATVGGSVSVLSAEPLILKDMQNLGGDIKTIAPLSSRPAPKEGGGGPVIVINPGGEETWDRIRSVHCANPSDPLIVLNNAYSTTYDLGNKRGFEEAYYLKRISKGWVFRAYPGPWQAYLEKPDNTVELLQSFKTKPSLKEIATLVREESFKRYAINNDRWFAGRL